MFDGVIRTLTDVRHIPELKQNPISLSTLDSKGYKYTGECGVIKVSRRALVVMKRQKNSIQLYILRGSIVTGDIAISISSLTNEEVTKLWHMSENGTTELSRRGLSMGKRPIK